MHISKAYKSTLEDMQNFLGYLEEFCDENEVSMKTCNAFVLSSEEIYTNIVKHGYKAPDGDVDIDLFIEENIVSIVFKDKAPAFDPLEHTDPDINLGVDDREIGGLGIFMVKKLMDDVKYEYKDNMNILTISKGK